MGKNYQEFANIISFFIFLIVNLSFLFKKNLFELYITINFYIMELSIDNGKWEIEYGK